MRFYLYVNGDVTYSNGTGNIEKVLSEAAKKEKRYMISNTDYRMLVSAAIKMQIEASKKLQFITYTFAFDPTEDEAQRIFNNHLKNLTKSFCGIYSAGIHVVPVSKPFMCHSSMAGCLGADPIRIPHLFARGQWGVTWEATPGFRSDTPNFPIGFGYDF